MKAAQVKLVISGRVQGVAFRYATREKARDLGVSGWVRNLPDGSVEVEASGPKEIVEKLIHWCRGGPPNAQVQKVSVEWLRDDNLNGTIDGGETIAPFNARQGKLEHDRLGVFEIR